MAFNPNDIYTSSGSVMLFNSWTPYVSKFDSSTFYNWEEDNVPLYDLEERTYELWEQQGFTTSAGVPGLALTVSSNVPTLISQQNNNIFSDLSSAIAAIPKVVRFPVLVEVGSFGDLGPLELHNFRVEEGGSIEIVNRNFARAYNASSTAYITSTATNSKYQRFVTDFSSIDLSNSISDTSCVHIGTKVYQDAGGGDARLTEGTVAVYPSHAQRNSPLSVAIKQSNIINTQANRFGVSIFESQSSEDDTIRTLDFSGSDTANGFSLARPGISLSQTLGGNFYGNYCPKITVQNCTGPIFIRNFFSDADQAVNHAIEVNNSNVVLENCLAVRAKKAGFKLTNSEVVLSRSAFSYRNYNLSSLTSRYAEDGIGFHLVNSDVTLSSNPVEEGSTSIGDTGAIGEDAAFVASRNTKGFVLDNSKIRGGFQRTSAAAPRTGGAMCSELNTSAGLVLNNSFVDVKGLVDIFGNNKGIIADNSFVKYENLTVEGNQEQGIVSNKSTFLYDSENNLDSIGGGLDAARRQLELSGNLVHLDLNRSSSFGFQLKDSVPQKYGNSFFRAAFTEGPAIKVSNNSDADLISPYVDVRNVAVNKVTYGRGAKAENNSQITFNGTQNGATLVIGPDQYSSQKVMAGVCAEDNSVINFHGPTVVAQFGVDVLASNNSVTNFEPRRIDGQYNVDISSFDLDNQLNHTAVELHSTRSCIVAEKHSVVNMEDLGAFPANWSSTPSGLQLLGDIDYTLPTSSFVSGGLMQFFPNPQDEATITAAGAASVPAFSTPLVPSVDGQITTMLFNRGLGNPQYTTTSGFSIGGVCLRAVSDSEVNIRNVHFPFPVNGSPADGVIFDAGGDLCERYSIWNIADTSRMTASYTSTSGMHPIDCLQHGPSALWASGDDIPVYEAPSGTPDTGSLSILDAFGNAPSAAWLPPSGVDINQPFDRFYPVSGDSALNIETRQILSEAGINVDGTDRMVFGVSGAYNNRGFFRIYWSPKASAKLLQADGSAGAPYQIFAQGYNCSANLSAIPPVGYANASSVAPDLLKQSYDENGDGVYEKLWTSGFYYCSEMLEENPMQCLLDESAADTFANARNASIGLAGRPKKTTIYNAGLGRSSEAYPGDGLVGFRSATVFDLSREN